MVVGKKTSHTEMDQLYINRDRFTKANTFMEKPMGWEGVYKRLEIGTRANLLMMFQRVMGFYIITIQRYMKDSSSMDYHKARVRRPKQTELSTSANFATGKSTEKDNLLMRTGLFTKEIL